jgi:cupin superfamily acireductone dioxygenase involved in methionine salvage
MGSHMIQQRENINKKQLTQENKTTLAEDDVEIEESSVMITSGSSGDTVVSRLQEQINQLQQEKESLKIDKVCLQQQNHELKNKIDDVAMHFPKTSILLGKNPEEYKKQKGLKIKLKRRK